MEGLDAAALTSPLALQVLIGVAGVVLLVRGASIYKWALWLAGFGVGAAGTAAGLLWLGERIPEVATPAAVGISALIAGITVAIATVWVHRLGLVAVGALLGATLVAAVSPRLGLPWWVALVGSAVGGAAMPWVFPHLLLVATPAVGAMLVAHALGVPTHLGVLGGLWLAGVVIQGLSQRSPPEDEE